MGCILGKGGVKAPLAAATPKWRNPSFAQPLVTDIHKDYDFNERMRPAAQGGYSDVYFGVEYATRAHVAIKRCRIAELTDADVEGLEHEVSCMNKIRHPNVVRLCAFYQTSHYYYLVMERCLGGELYQLLGDADSVKRPLCEQDARRYVTQICGAICAIHELGIAHRDLKPENILLDWRDMDASVKVADFGFAKHFATDTMATLAGTWHYVAPEVIDAEVDLGGYGPAADLWSVGVLTYQLLSGSLPFDGSVAQLVEQISRARFSFPPELFDNVSDEAKDFVRCLLVTDPSDRMTAAQALQHRWLSHEPTQRRVLPNVTKSLHDFYAHRKLRGALLAARTVTSLGSSFRSPTSHDGADTGGGRTPRPYSTGAASLSLAGVAVRVESMASFTPNIESQAASFRVETTPAGDAGSSPGPAAAACTAAELPATQSAATPLATQGTGTCDEAGGGSPPHQATAAAQVAPDEAGETGATHSPAASADAGNAGVQGAEAASDDTGSPSGGVEASPVLAEGDASAGASDAAQADDDTDSGPAERDHGGDGAQAADVVQGADVQGADVQAAAVQAADVQAAAVQAGAADDVGAVAGERGCSPPLVPGSGVQRVDCDDATVGTNDNGADADPVAQPVTPTAAVSASVAVAARLVEVA